MNFFLVNTRRLKTLHFTIFKRNRVAKQSLDSKDRETYYYARFLVLCFDGICKKTSRQYVGKNGREIVIEQQRAAK